MRNWLCTVVALALLGSLARAGEFTIGAHKFTLPEGFTIELVAGTNLVPRPIEADFDEAGRLYVTDSSGSNDKVEKQLAEKPHRVVRLEDKDGDGRFDASTVFADRLMLPQGALWRDGSLYVAAPPSIWKLTDTNSDGVADVRSEWFAGKTLTGCANDLHGPYAGPEGWIYWAKGAFAKQSYTLPNGKPFTTRASHLFRARPDGTGLEPVMTGGMDNPVGLVFTPAGERIFSCTFFQHPEGGRRDGLVHAVHGGVYGKIHDVIDEHPRTGEVLPVLTHLGPAAPAGMTRYASEVFGAPFRDNLFVACFNLHKVTRHVLVPAGATFTTRDEDFLVSDNADFHPTDVLEDADGSLVVIDTGGWYKLCCPTSQLHKPDVLGGIYRIRRADATRVIDPRGEKIGWNTLTPYEVFARLADGRPAVRERAIEEVAARGVKSTALMERALKIPSVEIRRILVWALTRVPDEPARRLVRLALNDADASVRLAALHSASAWRDGMAMSGVMRLLTSATPPEQRVAAEFVGRVGYAGAVPQLLGAAGQKEDRVLEHAITYALIEIGDAERTARGLEASDARIQRAAMIALSEMPGAPLQPEQALRFLNSTNALLAETASWVLSRHQEWADALAKHFAEQLRALADEAARAALQKQLEQFARSAAVQRVLLEAIGSTNLSAQVTALRALARSGVKELPTEWLPTLIVSLEAQDPRVIAATIAAVRVLPPPKTNAPALNAALLDVAERINVPPQVRVAAAAAVNGGIRSLSEPLYNRLLATLVTESSTGERADAARALAQARLSDARLRELAAHTRRIGPMELPRVLTAFAQSTNDAVGLRLVESLAAAKSLASVRPEALRSVLTNYSTAVQERGEALLASLHTDAAQQKAHLDELLAATKGGDVRRGQMIFNSAKAACASCHAIGYLGGKLGPDLTRIGQVRSERDLLEAIVYPSASLVRSYEPMTVVTKAGEEFSGVLRKDAPDEVVLATGPATEQRIARDDVAEMRPGTVSTMPGGLAEQLTKEELADLLAFLKATRW